MATQPPYANENSEDDPAPFIQLAAVTKNVMRYLAKKENPTQKPDSSGETAKAKRGKTNQDYVDRHLTKPGARICVGSGR